MTWIELLKHRNLPCIGPILMYPRIGPEQRKNELSESHLISPGVHDVLLLEPAGNDRIVGNRDGGLEFDVVRRRQTLVLLLVVVCGEERVVGAVDGLLTVMGGHTQVAVGAAGVFDAALEHEEDGGCDGNNEGGAGSGASNLLAHA